MDRSSSHASPISHAQDVAFDSLTRSLSVSLPRRSVLGLLAATLVTGSISAVASPAGAARRRKRSKRRSGQHGLAVSERATSIPPNCIYVCCDGTCDSWKMCMKCVKWPKPTTTGGVLTQA
ncbi:MAG: hypothetical protein U0075_00990 [Thermomicrobiales bacterium]